MLILKTKGFADYELIDSGNGQRLERFGKYTLVRPDPQAIWKTSQPDNLWNDASATFEKTLGDKGIWKKKNLPEKWEVKYKNLTFLAKLSPFKHTGIFPEQHLQWDFIGDQIKSANGEVKILNLFGYTGGASLAAAAAGAIVTHVDASRSAIGWAKENQLASNLEDKPIRWILDDALKFVKRELNRGNKYEGIIMDPPIYGHGPDGEVWDFPKHFPELLEICTQLLSDKPLFLIINAYAISASSLMLENILKDYLKIGQVESGELVLVDRGGRELSTGIFARWSGVIL